MYLVYETAYWNFDTSNNYAPWSDNGDYLKDVSRYASGPCQGKTGGNCRFDTRTFFTHNGHQIESITAHGRRWNFDTDNNYAPWGSNGSYLTSVSRYANGPCQGKTGGNCHFDTRTFFTHNGHQIESITAYGKYWNFDASNNYAPWPGNGNYLTSVSRYASGPCQGKTGGNCDFDTRAFFTYNGHQIESITAYGKYWNFDASNNYAPWPDNGSYLTSVSRYASGPCLGKAGGNCRFDTCSFFMYNGHQIESITGIAQ